MTIDEFRKFAETWGGDIARWPAQLRPDAEALAGTPAATAVLEAARRLDRSIAGAAPAIDADRINRALLNVATAIAAQGQAPPRSPIARWWLLPAASFACAVVVGVSLGMSLPLSSLRRPAEPASVLSMLFDGDSIETSWIGQ